MEVLAALLAVAAAVLALPALFLLTLTVCAGPKKSLLGAAQVTRDAALRVAVLVPAHNESIHVLPTIACLKAQLGPRDRLLVIADNCQDDTAALAREAGADVLERSHASERGKGYALAFGVNALRQDAPDVVLVVDADCVISEGALAQIAQHCAATQCPVQMLDLMVAPAGAGLRTRILEFAWRVKNQVRPKGAFNLGRACHLMGTGMALPWALISKANLATGHIAEDMKLGVDLALADRPTQFLETAQITSEFPLDAAVARAQKARWEHGHLRTLGEELPRILLALLRRPRRALLVLAMDLVIPPLALYFLTVVLAWPVSALAAWLLPALAPVARICSAGVCMLGLAIALAWLRFARDLLSLGELVTIPLYALWKIPVYIAYFMNRKSGWVKTRRKI